MTTEQIISMGISAGYNVDLALKVGLVEAIVLNKLVFLHRETKREDGYTWYTSTDWKKHTGLSAYQVRRAMEKLVNLGYIEVMYAQIPGTTITCRHHRFITSSTDIKHECGAGEVASEKLQPPLKETTTPP